jgi:hypothetical protein
MRQSLYLAGLFIISLVTGCASISYKPSLSLGPSPQTIKANVKIETFADESPASDKNAKAFGVSACESNTLQGELAQDVTDAVLTDFGNNMVFQNFKQRFDTQPDLVMTGTIHRFYGTSAPNGVFWGTIVIDTVWLFGIPIISNEGGVNLDITLSRPNGTVVGTYHGQSDFSKSYSMYHNATLSVPTQLNNAFSQSIDQIRQQILKDSDKLSRQQQAALN